MQTEGKTESGKSQPPRTENKMHLLYSKVKGLCNSLAILTPAACPTQENYQSFSSVKTFFFNVLVKELTDKSEVFGYRA